MRILLLLVCFNLSAYEFIGESQGFLNRWRLGQPITWKSTLPEADTVLARECFQQWSAATDGLLTFVEGGNGIQLGVQSLDYASGEMYPNSYDADGYYSSVTAVLSNKHTPGSPIAHAVLLHEIGHALGMGHADGTWPGIDYPTMYASAVGAGQATLHIDDINGIRALYGLQPRVAQPLTFFVTKVKARTYSVMASDGDAYAVWTAPKKAAKFDITWTTNLGQTQQGNPITVKLKGASAKLEAYWNGQYGSVILGKQPKAKR